MNIVNSILSHLSLLPKKEEEKLIRLRRIHEHAVRDGSLTKVFRPGTSGYADFYFPGEDITLVVIEKPGNDSLNVEPLFIKDIYLPIRITKVEARPLGEFTNEVLVGSSFRSFREVILELALVYNKNITDITDDFIITSIEFEYLETGALNAA